MTINNEQFEKYPSKKQDLIIENMQFALLLESLGIKIVTNIPFYYRHEYIREVTLFIMKMKMDGMLKDWIAMETLVKFFQKEDKDIILFGKKLGY